MHLNPLKKKTMSMLILFSLLTCGCINKSDSASEFDFNKILTNDSYSDQLESNDVQTLYVSSKGDDSKTGTSQDDAYKTIQKAIDESKRYIDKSDVLIKLLDDNYQIIQPIEINGEHTDPNGKHKLIVEGSDKTSISGGKVLDSKWIKSDEKNIWTYDCANENIEDIDGLYVDNVLYNEAQLELVTDFNNINLVKDANGIIKNITFTFANESNIYDKLKNLESTIDDMQLIYRWEWKNSVFNIEKIENNNGKMIVHLSNDTLNILNGKTSLQNDFIPTYNQQHIQTIIKNNEGLLTNDNEYYYNSSDKKLYLYSNKDPNEESVIIPQSNGLLNITGSSEKFANNIVFSKVKFEYGTHLDELSMPFLNTQADYGYFGTTDHYLFKLRAGQINLNFCSNVDFKNCLFSNIDSTALTMDQYVYNTTIENSGFDSIGGVAIRVGSVETEDVASKDRRPHKQEKDEVVLSVDTDVRYGYNHMPQNIKIYNNYIQNVGTFNASSPAVNVMYGYIVDVKNNTIKDTPYTGISVGWGWNNSNNQYITKNSGKINIESNAFLNNVTTLKDGAPIYTLGYFGEGVTISKNYINTNVSEEGYHGGIYLDEGSENIDITDNVVIDCSNWIDERISPRPELIDYEKDIYRFGGINTNTLLNITIKNNYYNKSNAASDKIDQSRISAQNIEGANVVYEDNTLVENWKQNTAVMDIVDKAGVQNTFEK